MQPTRPASLVVAVLAAAAVAWLGIDRFYGSMPRLTWLPALTLGGLAVVEAVAGWQTRARIERRPGAGPLVPLLIARYVVLAKASAMAGAIFAGLYLGLGGWLLAQPDVLAQARLALRQAVAGTVGAAALVVAAVWLERCCRVPSPPGSDPAGNGRTGADGPGDDPGSRGR